MFSQLTKNNNTGHRLYYRTNPISCPPLRPQNLGNLVWQLLGNFGSRKIPNSCQNTKGGPFAFRRKFEENALGNY